MKKGFARDIVVVLLTVIALGLMAHTYMRTTNVSTALHMNNASKINFSATDAAAADITLGHSATEEIAIIADDAVLRLQHIAAGFAQTAFFEGSGVEGFIGYISPTFATVKRRDLLELGVNKDAGGISFRGSEGELSRMDSVGILTVKADPLTLGAAATTFAAKANIITLTGDGGANTIATITGFAHAGDANAGILTLLFVDALITITDTDAHTTDTVDLNAAFTSADDVVLRLLYDGTSYYEISRSTN